MPIALYDDVYSVPLAYKRPEPRLVAMADELEFSEYGRSPVIPAGWYIAPALLIVPAALLLLLV
jgi:hypothetical protein